jgi:hypothetical protein
MLFESFTQAGIVGKLVMIQAFATMAMGLLCAFRPSERLLALMRPLSLAAIFGGLCSFAAGIAIVLRGIAASPNFAPSSWSSIALGTSEAFIALVVTFVCLTVAWLFVGVGLWRGGVQAS